MAPGSPPDDPVRGLVPCFLPPRLLQSGASFLLFSPLPRLLQSVAPGSPPDDPVLGLVPCFIPPRVLHSGASFYRILSVASDARIRGTGFSPGRSSPGAWAVLDSAPDAPVRGVLLSYSLRCLGRCSPWHRVHPRTIQSGGSGRAPSRPGCSNPGRLVSSSLCWRLRVRCFGAFFFARPSSLLLPRSPLLRCPWHLVPCRGSSCVVRASRVRGTRWPLPLGTCPRAVVVAGFVPLWCASWPRVGAPLLVRSGRSRYSGRLSRCHGAFPHPGGCRPRLYWVAARGTWRPAGNRAHVPAAGPCRGEGAGRPPRRTRLGPRDGVVPGGSFRLQSWAPCAAVVWRVWNRSLTCPVSRTIRLATGDSAGAPGLFCVDADTAPFGPEDATPGSRACVRVRALLGRVGRAGLPGAFWCASLFLWPFLVRSLLVRPPPGWGCPVCCCCWFFFSFSPSPPSLRHRCVLLCVFSDPGSLGPWRLVPPPFFLSFLPPPPFLSPTFPAFQLSGACAPPPLFFPLFLVIPFSGFFFPVVRCGAGLCVFGCRVCALLVPRWCCPCRCRPCVGWCCVVFAVGPGCPLLSPGVSWSPASVVLSLSGRVARRPVVRHGVSWCSAALCCVLLHCAVVWWCAVVLCRLFRSLPAPVICFLPLRVRCVCSGVSCCLFPVLSALCGGVLRCAGALSWCSARRLCCSWWLVLLVPGVAAFCWGSAGGSGCPALSFGGVCRLGCPCLVWPSLAVFPVVSCSPVLCPVALCCLVVLCCGALFFFLLAGGAGFLLFPVGSGLRAGSGSFLFLCSARAVLRWCACVVALCSVLSCPRGAGWCFVLLPVVFVCLLLGLAVLCCLLVGPGGSWCHVSVACCGVSPGAVLRRVAARCAAWRCVVVRCCVLGRCPSSWGPVASGAVFCPVPSRCVCFAVACRCVVLFAVVLCAVCALGCRVVRFLSSPPCAVLLCGPLSLGALLPCAVPRGAVLPRGAVVSCPAALSGLFLAWVWLYLLEKPLQNFVNYFFLLFFGF